MIIIFKKQKDSKITQMLEWAEKNFKLLYSHYKDVQGSKRKNRHNKETDEESKLRNEHYKWK